MLTQVKTVATSIVAKLLALHAVLTAVIAEASTYVDVPVVGKLLPYVVSAAGVVWAVARIVARVSEVPDQLQGLKPVSDLDLGGAFIDRFVESDVATPDDVAFWTYRGDEVS